MATGTIIGGGATPWRVAGWGALAALVLLPLVAMQFTSEVAWTGSDFALAAALLGLFGLGCEVAFRSASWTYRGGAVFALLTGVLTVVGTLAVGFIGSETNPANLLFLGVLGIAAGGAVLVRFRPAGMARAMIAAFAAQALIAAAAAVSLGTPREGAFILLLGTVWLAAAALFARAR